MEQPSMAVSGYGTVFKLKQYNSNWILTPLYNFTGYDGANPYAGITFGPDGSLFGTTNSGGSGQGCGFGCGVVYNLQPPPTRPATPLSPWNETVLHRFYEFTDGDYPYSPVVFDQAGNMYGTTLVGGTNAATVRFTSCSARAGVGRKASSTTSMEGTMTDGNPLPR